MLQNISKSLAMDNEKRFAKVILPLKLHKDIHYVVPEILSDKIFPGSFVRVNFAGREYIALVDEINCENVEYEGNFKYILFVEEVPPAPRQIVKFWEWLADYYMCTKGEVFKSAASAFSLDLNPSKKRKKELGPEGELLPQLSDAQKSALENIESEMKNRPVVLNGVTGSGKTEIYLHLAKRVLESGKSVLYLLPESAISSQISKRVEKYFGDKLLIYNYKQPKADKRNSFLRIIKGEEPYIVLGLRSAIFLPYKNLGLVIVDEEHDSSYKQSEPAPRYNGRDSAVVLSSLFNTPIILGSATPSLESIHNIETGKYAEVVLSEKFHNSQPVEIKVLNTLTEKRGNRMSGPFANYTLEQMESCLERGEQVIVFRNRRSYSPYVQCDECGHIPYCSHCNIPLSYHKYRGTISCHYCGESFVFTNRCNSCGNNSVTDKGYGTEKIEEFLRERFSDKVIERFDADTTSSKTEEKRIIKEFSQNKANILVGTQMLSKGFHFSDLTLVCLLQAESLFATQDFRASERAVQMMNQLSGRAGRENKPGKMIIQTSGDKNEVYSLTGEYRDVCSKLIEERKEFLYPPFLRIIRIVVKDRDRKETYNYADKLYKLLCLIKGLDFSGPFAPVNEKLRGEFILNFWIKLPKDNRGIAIKKSIKKVVDKFSNDNPKAQFFCDVDPF